MARRRGWQGTAALVSIVAAIAAGALAGSARAERPTLETLAAQGWSCFTPPGAPRTVCGNPGLGRPPLPPGPADRPSYMLLAFALDGSYLGTIHLIRADLYAGQPCGSTGAVYAVLPNGYRECRHF